MDMAQFLDYDIQFVHMQIAFQYFGDLLFEICSRYLLSAHWTNILFLHPKGNTFLMEEMGFTRKYYYFYSIFRLLAEVIHTDAARHVITCSVVQLFLVAGFRHFLLLCKCFRIFRLARHFMLIILLSQLPKFT